MDALPRRAAALTELTSVADWLPFLRRDLGALEPWLRFLRGARGGRRARLRGDPRRGVREPTPRSATTCSRCCSGSPRGRRADDRRRAARRADDAADGRPRDHRDRRSRGRSSGCCARRACSSGWETLDDDDYAGRGREGDPARAAGGDRRGAQAHARHRDRPAGSCPAGTLVLPAIAVAARAT